MTITIDYLQRDKEIREADLTKKDENEQVNKNFFKFLRDKNLTEAEKHDMFLQFKWIPKPFKDDMSKLNSACFTVNFLRLTDPAKANPESAKTHIELLSTLIDRGQITETLNILQRTTEKGGHTFGHRGAFSDEANTQQYLALLSRLIQKGQADAVLALLKQTNKNGETFGWLVSSTCKEKGEDDYVNLLTQLIQAGKTDDVFTLALQTAFPKSKYIGVYTPYQSGIAFYLKSLEALLFKEPVRVFELLTARFGPGAYYGLTLRERIEDDKPARIYYNALAKSALAAIEKGEDIAKYLPYKQAIVRYLLALPNDQSTLDLLEKYVKTGGEVQNFLTTPTGTGVARAIAMTGNTPIAIAQLNTKIATIEQNAIQLSSTKENKMTSDTAPLPPSDLMPTGQKSHGISFVDRGGLANVARQVYGIEVKQKPVQK